MVPAERLSFAMVMPIYNAAKLSWMIECWYREVRLYIMAGRFMKK